MLRYNLDVYTLDRQTPLLLTGTIDSGVYNNTGNIIRSVSIRLNQYEIAIEKYIKETPFSPIVFIENSGYPFNESKFKETAQKYNKNFEFISGKICKEEILLHGKSYGDAYLVQEALYKSELLKECTYFYKISGRIFLKNAAKICRTQNKYRNEFIVYQHMKWCFTNIFKANKDDYLKVCKDVYLDCDEASGNDVERVFFQRLSSADIEIGSFEVYPYFEGVMGATGENYSGSLPERVIRNVMARLHCFSINSNASSMMALAMKIIDFK